MKQTSHSVPTHFFLIYGSPRILAPQATFKDVLIAVDKRKALQTWRQPCLIYWYEISIVDISTLLKNIDIVIDIVIFKNIDIEKAILENIDSEIDIDMAILKNIDIDRKSLFKTLNTRGPFSKLLSTKY